MKNRMFDLCVGSVVASAFVFPGQALAENSKVDFGVDEKYQSYPVYQGSDLELSIDGAVAKFRVWSPKSESVMLRLYANARGGEALKTIDMKKDVNGTWVASLTPVPYGSFYTFQIKDNGKWLAETPGIWAKAVGTNGERAAIVDMAATNPAGWASDRGPQVKAINDAIIYEMHHRDFSVHPNSGIVNKGKFIAMLENGTVTPLGDKTGIDHLKELGITHVHILPSYDFNSVDETQLPSNGYNWGYDPVNYNAPEGSYSTNPVNPVVRIREMKEMVKALHDAGIGVVMDVVYNHTAQNDDSNFSLTAPGYFYRHKNDGGYSDAS